MTTTRMTAEERVLRAVFGDDNEAPVYGPGIVLTRAQRADRIAWEISTTVDPDLSNTRRRLKCREMAKTHGELVADKLWVYLGMEGRASPYKQEPNMEEDVVKYVQHKELMCRVHSISYDFASKTGVLRMDDGNFCDMQGCTGLFERISPDVERIETYSGNEADTFYKKTKAGWVVV